MTTGIIINPLVSNMKLTDTQKIEIVGKYLAGESSVKLSREYNVSKKSILSILEIRNIPRRKTNMEKRYHNYDENYFQKWVF